MADLLRRTSALVDTLAPVDEAERLGAGYLLDTARAELAVIESGERERRMSNEIGPPSMLLAALDVMPRESPDDWERIAERMAAVPDALDGYVTSLRAGLAHDRVSSVRLVRAVAQSCRRFSGTGSDGAFGAIADEYGAGALTGRLHTQARRADEEYGRLADWLMNDVASRPASRGGCSSVSRRDPLDYRQVARSPAVTAEGGREIAFVQRPTTSSVGR